MSQVQKSPTTLLGKVVSIKMNKTISVRVERLIPHPVYKKYIRKSVNILAHDENNETKEGDIVSVISCRPISKRKVWKLKKAEEQAS
jgi:small subunit ribosomal protein S17